MTDAANRLTTGKGDISSKLHELQVLVSGLVQGDLVTDAASGAFHSSYEQFTKGTTEAVSGLNGMSQFLTKAASALENVDSELAKGIGG